MKNQNSHKTSKTNSKPLNHGMSYQDMEDQELHIASLRLSTLRIQTKSPMKREILASHWRSPGLEERFIGIVAAITDEHLKPAERTWMAYMGIVDPNARDYEYVLDGELTQDQQHIAALGQKLSEEEGRFYFPHLKDRKYKI